ncbi:MAG: hypothetical protein ACRET4_19080 [Steroidobacteraceae bacterium]
MEIDDVVLIIDRALETKAHEITGLQLEVANRFGRDEQAIRPAGKSRKRIFRAACREKGVSERRRAADRVGMDAV